jgi:hypothetical protein
MSRLLTVFGVVVTALVLVLSMAPGRNARAASSEQIIFSDSGSGSGTFINPANGNPTQTHFGFWVWCEGDSTNPYQGRCNGAMYFYAFAITKHVDGSVSELGGGSYMMSVASKDGSISCALTNAPPVKSGLNNTVNVTCSSPAGSGSDTRAVVKVTGP